MNAALYAAQVLLLLLAIASAAALVTAHFWPKSRASGWLEKVFRRKPSSLSQLNRTLHLDFSDFALIEQNIPRLKSVVVISNIIEQPTRQLRIAVADNFQEGAKYCFFVSPEFASGERLSEYYDWFSHVYEAAKTDAPFEGEKSSIRGTAFDELFKVYKLDRAWNHVPFVFYTFANGGGKLVNIALKGNVKGVGISDHYVRIGQAEADVITELCAGLAEEFRRILPPREVHATLPEAEVVDISDFQQPLDRRAGRGLQ